MADLLTTAKERFQLAMEAYAESRQDQLDDLKFAAGSPDNGWQWPQDVRLNREQDKNGARPCLTINKLTEHVNQVVNDQRQNRPSIKVLPVDDKSDPEVAEILNGIIRHIEVSSDADTAYDIACDSQVRQGEGYFRVITDYCDENSFDQDIKIGRITDPFSVYLDPVGLRQDATGAKCEWGFILDSYSEDEFKREFPNAEEIDWNGRGVGDTTWFENKTIRVAEYFYIERKKKTLYLWANGQVTDSEDPRLAGLTVLDKPARKREVEEKIVKWCKLNGQEVLEEQVWPGKYIPIVRVVGNEFLVEGKTYVSGLVRNAKDAQRMYNYWVSQEVEMLALAPKAPFIGVAGQFEGFEDKWGSANTVNYPYLEYNQIVDGNLQAPPPQRSLPPMPQTAIIQAKQGAADDIKSATGQYNASLGMHSNETSGKAILARQKESDTGTFHYIDNLSKAIRHLGRIIIDLIPKIYDTRRVARIIGVDGEPDHAALDPNAQNPVQPVQDDEGKEIGKIYNPSIGQYDVVVTTGPSYSTKRVEAADSMSQLVQANPQLWQVIGDLLVKNMDWPGADEISERIKKTMDPKLLDDKDEDPRVQQAMGMIDQLSKRIHELMDDRETQEMEIKQREVEVKAYDAETKRIQVISPAIGPEDVQMIVLKTMEQVFTGPEISHFESEETPQHEMTESPMMQMAEGEPPDHMMTQNQPPQGGFFTPEGM